MSPGSDNIEYVELGKVVSVWGLKGWVNVLSYTKRREDILSYRTWYLGEEREKRKLVSGHQQGLKVVALLDGLDCREAASPYVGKTVSISAAALPKLAAGEYYWAQLQGLNAVTASGSHLGVVDHVFETGANDVLVIRQGTEEYLIPYIPDVVRKVDLEQGRIELDWETEF